MSRHREYSIQHRFSELLLSVFRLTSQFSMVIKGQLTSSVFLQSSRNLSVFSLSSARIAQKQLGGRAPKAVESRHVRCGVRRGPLSIQLWEEAQEMHWVSSKILDF